MKINKTADECVVESALVLLKCFVDPNLSLIEKQKFTEWITWFLDFQDAVNNINQKEINYLKEKLNLTSLPIYYKNALQEFQNANLFYNENLSLKELAVLFLKYSTEQTNNIVNAFSKVFIKAIESYITLENIFIKNFQILIYTIHYHITYLFKTKLENTIKIFIKILKAKVFYKTTNEEILLINIILNENEVFFSQIQEIQLTNFIYKLEEIFQEFNNDTNQKLDDKLKNLIFAQPKKINTSMNTLLKNHDINFYNEIWSKKSGNEQNTKLLMHLFAYETYFVQGQGNHEIYEELVLKNIIQEEKYWIIIHKYKLLNKIV